MHLVSGEHSDSDSKGYANCFPVKPWFDGECHECVRILRRAQKKKKSRIHTVKKENTALYNETRKHFQVLKAKKQEAWRNSWREFWSGDPREIWHFIRQLMGRGGSECECPPEEISAHFSDVGKPPDDPDFFMNCLVEAQHWIAENFQNDNDDSPDLQAFSTREVIERFNPKLVILRCGCGTLKMETWSN